jgi:hypothetical protein
MVDKSPRALGPETQGNESPADRWTPKGSPGRVAIAHHQAWPTLRLATGFMAAAAAVAILGGAPRWWMALHLLLVGGVLGAISATTQMFAITWSAAPPPPTPLVVLQRWMLAGGAVALVFGRELEVGTWLVGLGGTAVLAALALLGYLLWRIRTRVAIGRHLATIDGYLLAVLVGMVGSSLGLVMAVGTPDPARVLDAHTTLNLFGMVGIVVAATVPSFFATQARTKMTARYRPRRARALLALMALGVGAAAAGTLVDSGVLNVVGLAVLLVAMAATGALMPRLGRRQWAWAGPRLAQVVAALGWWLIAVGWAIVIAADPASAPGGGMQRVWLVLAVGGVAQLVVGSLAYLGPIIRGRERRGQQQAFAITRSWLSLVVGNVAAVAVAGGWWNVASVALAVWVLDTVTRAVVLVVRVRPRPAPLPLPA